MEKPARPCSRRIASAAVRMASALSGFRLAPIDARRASGFVLAFITILLVAAVARLPFKRNAAFPDAFLSLRQTVKLRLNDTFRSVTYGTYRFVSISGEDHDIDQCENGGCLGGHCRAESCCAASWGGRARV